MYLGVPLTTDQPMTALTLQELLDLIDSEADVTMDYWSDDSRMSVSVYVDGKEVDIWTDPAACKVNNLIWSYLELDLWLGDGCSVKGAGKLHSDDDAFHVTHEGTFVERNMETDPPEVTCTISLDGTFKLRDREPAT